MKNMKMKLGNILLLICIILMTISFFTVYFRQPGEVIKNDTITTIKYDTLWRDTVIVKEKPVVKEKVKIKTDTVYTKGGDSILLETEHKTYQERLVSAKDTCDLEIHTTGINTTLDSLKWRLKTHTDVVTKTVEGTKYVQKKKTLFDHVHVGLQVGYGYGLRSKEMTPYAGVGITVNW